MDRKGDEKMTIEFIKIKKCCWICEYFKVGTSFTCHAKKIRTLYNIIDICNDFKVWKSLT